MRVKTLNPNVVWLNFFEFARRPQLELAHASGNGGDFSLTTLNPHLMSVLSPSRCKHGMDSCDVPLAGPRQTKVFT